MKIRMLTPRAYKINSDIKVVAITLCLASTVLHLLLDPKTGTYKYLAIAGYLTFMFMTRYDYLISRKEDLHITPEGIKNSSGSISITPSQIKRFTIEIRGYSGEPNYSRFSSFKSTGFDNRIHINSSNIDFETKVYLNNPNDEKALITLLDRNYSVEAKRFV